MTEEEREEAQVQDTKAQINRVLDESVQAGGRIRLGADEAFERMLEGTRQTDDQRKKLLEIEQNLRATGTAVLQTTYWPLIC